jgi:surface antigen
MKKLLCALIAAGLVSAAAITTVAHAAPALADTITYSNLGYPWVAAHCATPDPLTGKCDTVPTDNWGYTSCPSNDTNCKTVVLNGYGVYDPWNYYLRNCTGFVAWKLASLGVNPKYFEGLGGGSWYDSAKKKGLVSVGAIPQVGAAAVAPGGDHVAYVSGYNKSTGVITVEEYNHDVRGDGDTWRVIRNSPAQSFADLHLIV